MSIWACLQVDVVAWALERRVVAGHRHGMRVACDHVYTKSIDTRHVHAVVMLAVRIWAACIVRMHLHRYEVSVYMCVCMDCRCEMPVVSSELFSVGVWYSALVRRC